MKAELERTVFEYVESTLKPALNNLPISYPNRDFEQPENGKYLEVIHLPNDTASLVWDEDEIGDVRGIFRFLVHWIGNVGTITPSIQADKIGTAFKKGTALYADGFRVLFERPPSAGTWVKTGDERFLPVTVWYRVAKP